jgi:hypothetical protein
MVACQMNLFLLSFHTGDKYFSGAKCEGWELVKKELSLSQVKASLTFTFALFKVSELGLPSACSSDVLALAPKS